MSYQVRLRRVVQKQLDGLIGREYQAVTRAIFALEQEPRPRGVKKLAESGLWRIRVGHCRVVYAINDKESLVTVARVARRTEECKSRGERI